MARVTMKMAAVFASLAGIPISSHLMKTRFRSPGQRPPAAHSGFSLKPVQSQRQPSSQAFNTSRGTAGSPPNPPGLDVSPTAAAEDRARHRGLDLAPNSWDGGTTNTWER